MQETRLEVLLLPARHGSRMPKTKAQALRLLGLTYAELHKYLDQRKPELIYPRSYLLSNIYYPPGMQKAIKAAEDSLSDENIRIKAGSIMAGFDVNEVPRLALEWKASLRYRDKNYNFILIARKLTNYESLSELPLTFLSGSKNKVELYKDHWLNDKLITVNEAASILRVHRDTIIKLIRQGKLEAIKLVGRWRITETSIKNLMKGEEQ